MLLIKLSEIYDISLIEVYKPRDGKIFKNFTVNLKPKDVEHSKNEHNHFTKKRQLVSWMMCLK